MSDGPKKPLIPPPGTVRVGPSRGRYAQLGDPGMPNIQNLPNQGDVGKDRIRKIPNLGGSAPNLPRSSVPGVEPSVSPLNASNHAAAVKSAIQSAEPSKDPHPSMGQS